MKSFHYLLFLFVGLVACDNEIQNDPAPPVQEQAFIFGSYAGFCAADCAEYYKIEDQKLYKSTIDFQPTGEIPFAETPLNDEQYQLALPLLEDFPNELYTSDQDVYGCPNCYDQGAIYFELREDDLIRTWEIDTDSTDQSAVVLDYKARVIEVLNALP